MGDEWADELQDDASLFEKQAGKLKNKFWLRSMKFIIVGAIVGLILLVLLYFKFSGDAQPPQTYYQPPPPVQNTLWFDGGRKNVRKQKQRCATLTITFTLIIISI